MPDEADGPVADATRALERVVAALPGGGEARPGQRAMVEAVATAVQRGRHLVVQAGTGTGKSLGYLVPAILSGRRVVVATATKALQDQLANKDLPFLAERLGHPFTWAVLKGRSNYLCVDKAREMAPAESPTVGTEPASLDLPAPGDGQEDVPSAERSQLARELLAILAWSKTTPTGDRAELSFEPRPRSWSRLSVTARECPGALRCPAGEDCLAEAAKQRAAQADVVVVNTHLYAVDVASGGQLLPEHDVLVLDEVHELEDIVATALGVEITPGRLVALARAVRAALGEGPSSTALEETAGRLATALEPLRGQALHRAPKPGPAELTLAAALLGASDRVGRALAGLRGKGNDGDGTSRRALKAAASLAEDLASTAPVPPGHVAWAEGPARHPVLRVAPVEVAELLAHALWGRVPRLHAAVLTSATVPVGLPARIGLPPGRFDEMDVGSPFDYGARSVLYCAAGLPDPRHPDHEAAMHAELEALVRAAGGRTLALFTSWRAMRSAATALRGRLPWRLLTQEDLPKPALLAAFTTDETSCLFATMGFWQGVDVPGRTLSLVVIDRIPFPRPDEPLLQARRDRAGTDAFGTVDLPRAATLLAQGVGRLIRSSADRGVVAVLDPRLATASYRAQLLRALPPMRRTALRANVERFLAES